MVYSMGNLCRYELCWVKGKKFEEKKTYLSQYDESGFSLRNYVQ